MYGTVFFSIARHYLLNAPCRYGAFNREVRLSQNADLSGVSIGYQASIRDWPLIISFKVIWFKGKQQIVF